MQPCLPITALTPFPIENKQQVDSMLTAACAASQRKIVVLDDDPTGVQTVHGVSVYTDWSRKTLAQGFAEQKNLFFILTNSRSFSTEQTRAVHAEIMENIAWAAAQTGKDYLIVSRGDSTLRGHYPLETQTLREGMERAGATPVDGEILCPYFAEGGRFTQNDVHYVRTRQMLTPAAQTEFAQDKTFGYTHSNLREYVQEKTNGAFPASGVTSIALADLRALRLDAVEHQLLQVRDFGKIIVNATDDYDVKVFCIALYRALEKGKRFCMRTAAAFVKALGNIPTRPLLSRTEMVHANPAAGGIVVIGSHTKKTTAQFAALTQLACTQAVELNAALVFTQGALGTEAVRIAALCDALIARGTTPVVYTTRTLLTLEQDTPEAALARSVEISDAVQSVVANLTQTPAFVVAKGGITSSDVGTKALRVRRATVLGQIQPGIPVWKTGAESRFPDIPYIIFPGNVGEETTLREVVEILTRRSTMKIGLIYTSTTPELIATVEQEVRACVGQQAQLFSLQDPTILAEVREAGTVTAAPAARLVGMYMQAAQEGCDAVLNLCSSVGEVADSAQGVARYLGMPIVRVDEEMCREAVRRGNRIAVLATLPTTLVPTKNTLLRVAREMGRNVELVDCLVEGAFGMDQDAFRARLLESGCTVADQADVIVLAQGSMAYCEDYLAQQLGTCVLSSPRFGAAALREALKAKGVLKAE